MCGDVGFGKTEVALRAAFAATQDKKQVMVLCPTTILAQQHFTNFKDRFEPFGVTVEVLSRFRTPQQQAAALKGFADGSVDVLVGTHRLLSRDVNPHDLGLVIIDEEQRFGVGHKEQMKNLRESDRRAHAFGNADSAHHADVAVGRARHEPHPHAARRSTPRRGSCRRVESDAVSAAIRRELARGRAGVLRLPTASGPSRTAVRRVQAAAGEARVGVAHGQMDKDSLEKVMEELSAGQLDVLVATTIIESGIDNPHTNTLIIEDSQRLGLAQLHQLKGPRGPWLRSGVRVLHVPEHVNLTEEAQARLTALDEHTDLGSGMRIAMRDLEIRRRRQLDRAPSSPATCRRSASTCSHRCSARP